MTNKIKKHSDILRSDNEWINKFIDVTDGIDSFADVIHFLIRDYQNRNYEQVIINQLKNNYDQTVQLHSLLLSQEKTIKVLNEKFEDVTWQQNQNYLTIANLFSNLKENNYVK